MMASTSHMTSLHRGARKKSFKQICSVRINATGFDINLRIKKEVCYVQVQEKGTYTKPSEYDPNQLKLFINFY